MGTEGFKLVGKSPRRVDGLMKCTGQTKFADDLEMPRMLFAKLHRSHVAHARIVSIDTSEAERMPGVVAVLTGESVPTPFGILPVSQDEHALCQETVRFIGDPVAAVAAVSEDTAFDAMNAIKVEYEPLTPVFSPEDAMKNEAPALHDYGDDGNVHKRVSMQFGDVEAGLAEADEILEDVFFFSGNTHLPMEQHASLAWMDPDGRVTLWSSTQTPHYLHRATSKVLDLPPSRVRIIATPNGGFGGKSDPFNHEIVAAKLATVTNWPVKITLTREEVFACHRGRHPTLMRSKLGLKNDGRITGLHFESLLDGGAYGSYGVATTYYTGALQTVTYQVPTYRFDGVRAFTNKAPCGPKRGHGTPQPRFALEVQIDKAAERLGLDPAELRLSILQPPNSVTANWLRVNTIHLKECIETVVRESGWKEKFGNLPRGRGVGLACSSYISGAGLPIYWNAMPHSGVQLKLDRGGGAAVFCGETDIGQGSDTVLATCVAEVLGIDLYDIRVCASDTDLTPVDLGSYSSRVTLMMGNAAIQAAERARELLAKAVAKELSLPGSRLVFAEGRVFDAEDPERGVAFAEAVQKAEAMFGTIGTVGSYRPPPSPARYRGGGVGPTATYSYSAAVVQVVADEETGIVTPETVWIAHDIGQAINRNLAIGQVEGGVYMGLGEALMEEMAYRPDKFGVMKIPSMLEYKSITTMEMPEVETFLVENPDPEGPFGAKEVGQGPLLPMMPAVANAVHDGLGVRVDQVPVTPELVLKALTAKDKRAGPTKFPDLRIETTMRVKTEEEGGDGDAPPAAPEEEEEGGVPRMMRLPPFSYQAPADALEAAKILREEGPSAVVVAGGTDLYPNMKRRHHTPATLVSLRNVETLRGIDWGDDGSLRIGPMTTLRELERDERLAADLPALHAAIRSISTPVLRNQGTIGGNLCLDTRCNYLNQNYEWRRAIDFCKKCDGDTCWVAPSSDICWAVNSSDSVPVMIALGASVRLVSADGEREVSAEALYAGVDGREWMTRRPNELMTDIVVPAQGAARSVYLKLRRRGAFDFPVLGVAARITGNGEVEKADVVLNAIGPMPVRCEATEAALAGTSLDDDTLAAAAKLAMKAAKPLDNTDHQFTWRRKMVPVFVKRALASLRS